MTEIERLTPRVRSFAVAGRVGRFARARRRWGRSRPAVTPARRTRGLVAALLAIALVGGVVIVADPGDVPAAVPKDAVAVDIAGSAAGPAIPSGFLGFSIEYPSSLSYSGTDAAAPNPTFIRLVRQLTPNGSPVIR